MKIRAQFVLRSLVAASALAAAVIASPPLMGQQSEKFTGFAINMPSIVTPCANISRFVT